MNQIIKHVKVIFSEKHIVHSCYLLSLILLIEKVKVQGFFMDNYDYALTHK